MKPDIKKNMKKPSLIVLALLINVFLFSIGWVLYGIAFTPAPPDPAPDRLTTLEQRVGALERDNKGLKARVKCLEDWAIKEGGKIR